MNVGCASQVTQSSASSLQQPQIGVVALPRRNKCDLRPIGRQHTGVFERDLSYLTKVMDHFADVDSVTEAEFDARVAEVRSGIS